MKFLTATFAYLRKNFLFPIVLMVIPSVVACLLSTPYMEVAFVTKLDNPYISASETFGLLFGDSWQSAWPVILICVLQTLCASIMMSAIDRQFRTGTLSLKSPMRLLNYSIAPLAIGVVAMCVVSILFRFVLYGLVMLVQVIFSAANAPAVACIVVISVFAVGVFILHVLAITSMLYWAPSMFIYGYKFRDAVTSSIKLIGGKKVYAGLMLPLTVCAAVQMLLGFLHVHVVVACIVGFVVFLFTNVYTLIYIILSFYMISGLERRDIKPYEIPLPAIAAVQKQKSEPTSERPADEDKKPGPVPAAAQTAAEKSAGKPSTVKKPSKKSSANAKNSGSNGGKKRTEKSTKKPSEHGKTAKQKTANASTESGKDVQITYETDKPEEVADVEGENVV